MEYFNRVAPVFQHPGKIHCYNDGPDSAGLNYPIQRFALRFAETRCPENPDNPTLDVYKLKGESGYSLRVGQYRIIYTRLDDQLIIEVVKIRPCGDINRR